MKKWNAAEIEQIEINATADSGFCPDRGHHDCNGNKLPVCTNPENSKHSKCNYSGYCRFKASDDNLGGDQGGSQNGLS